MHCPKAGKAGCTPSPHTPPGPRPAGGPPSGVPHGRCATCGRTRCFVSLALRQRLPVHVSGVRAGWQRSRPLGTPPGGCRRCRRSARLAAPPGGMPPGTPPARAGGPPAAIASRTAATHMHPPRLPQTSCQATLALQPSASCIAGRMGGPRRGSGRAAGAVAARCALCPALPLPSQPRAIASTNASLACSSAAALHGLQRSIQRKPAPARVAAGSGGGGISTACHVRPTDPLSFSFKPSLL